MKLFSIFMSKRELDPIRDIVPESIDKSNWTGKDFDFLITGMVQIEKRDYDKIMTPKTFEWTRLSPKWPIYKVGNDEYGFSFESYGIDITFNETMEFKKAKKIADEIIENIASTGQEGSLHVVAKPRVYLKQN